MDLFFISLELNIIENGLRNQYYNEFCNAFGTIRNIRNFIRNLYNFIPKRIQSVMRAKGNVTMYFINHISFIFRLKWNRKFNWLNV